MNAIMVNFSLTIISGENKTDGYTGVLGQSLVHFARDTARLPDDETADLDLT